MEELPGQSTRFPGNITVVIPALPAIVAVKQENLLLDVTGPEIRDIIYHVIQVRLSWHVFLPELFA